MPQVTREQEPIDPSTSDNGLLDTGTDRKTTSPERTTWFSRNRRRIATVGAAVVAATIATGLTVSWVRGQNQERADAETKGELEGMGFNASPYGVNIEDGLMGVACDETRPNSPTVYFGVREDAEGDVVAYLPGSSNIDAKGQVISTNPPTMTELGTPEQVAAFLGSSNLSGWCKTLAENAPPANTETTGVTVPTVPTEQAPTTTSPSVVVTN